MTDREKDRTMKEIISDAVERQLAKEPSREVSFEEFTALIEKAETRRKKRRLRMVMYAAMFFIAIIGAAAVFNTLTTDVGANKNEKEEIVTEDGVVIEDGGYGASGEDAWVISSWGELEAVKKVYPELITFEYMPEGYDFELLSVRQVETDGKTMEYIFSNGGNGTIEIEIFILENAESSLDIQNVSRMLSSSKGKIYVQGNKGIKRATIQTDDGLHIKIWGDLADEEFIKIIENLSN